MSADNKVQSLFTAIEKDDIEQVKELLASGVSANSLSDRGQTALVVASSRGNVEIIEALVNEGAEINPKPEPPVVRPQIYTTQIPGGWSLGELIAQATENADEQTQAFYSGFMGFVEGLSTPVSDAIEDVSISIDDEQEDEEDFDEPVTTPLINAIQEGNLEAVKALIGAGAEINPQTWNELVPLVAAVEKGNVEMIQTLIAAGADVNRLDFTIDASPLGTAIQQERTDLVKLLLDAGASPEGGDVSNTGLALAIEQNNLEIFQMLLDAGADVNRGMEDDYRAIMLASNRGRLEMVKMLVAQGADVNAWSQGETALLSAARNGEREVYNFLYPLVDDEIRRRADRDGQKDIQAALKRKAREANQAVEDFIKAAMYGRLAEVQQAISNGIDVNAIGSNGQTALMYAAQFGQISVVQTLLDAGADPNILTDSDDGLGEEMTALMQVAGSFFAGNRHEVVRLLVQAGADINLQGVGGKTALMYAANNGSGYIESVKTLVNLGANLDIRDNDGNTLLMQVELVGHQKIAEILRKAGASEEGMAEIALIKAASDGNIQKVQELITSGVNVNHHDGSALNRAIYAGNQEIVELLIKAGADVNLGAKSGLTPLAEAAYEGYTEIVQILRDAGADIHARCHNGDTYNAIEYAVIGFYEGHHKGKGHTEIIQILEQAGAINVHRPMIEM
ncbi:ankyrin repeat domain-containing protein [Nostoc sp. NIES-2111]